MAVYTRPNSLAIKKHSLLIFNFILEVLHDSFIFPDVSVRFTEDNFRVNEDEGTVTICVRRIGDSASSITVTIRSRETAPASARGKQALLYTLKLIQTFSPIPRWCRLYCHISPDYNSC